MAGKPRMNDEPYARLPARFDKSGFVSSELKKVPQFPEQIGHSGFQ